MPNRDPIQFEVPVQYSGQARAGEVTTRVCTLRLTARTPEGAVEIAHRIIKQRTRGWHKVEIAEVGVPSVRKDDDLNEWLETLPEWDGKDRICVK